MNQTQSGESKAQIEAATGLTFPADATVLYSGGSERQGENFRQYVLRSGTRFAVHKGSEAVIPADSVLATITTVVPKEQAGTISGSEANVSDWTNGQQEWRASTVKTTTGWLLHLEEFGKK